MKNLSGSEQVNKTTNNESKFSLFFKKFSEMISDDQFNISVCSFQNILSYFAIGLGKSEVSGFCVMIKPNP